jgi:hypothetical protein
VTPRALSNQSLVVEGMAIAAADLPFATFLEGLATAWKSGEVRRRTERIRPLSGGGELDPTCSRMRGRSSRAD